MNKSYFFGLLLLLSTSSFAQQTPNSEDVKYQFEIINKDETLWRFRHLEVASENNELKGKLKAPAFKRPEKGHIDVAVYDTSGKLLTQTTARYSYDFLSPKNKRPKDMKFTAPLTVSLPNEAVFRVAFHPDEPSTIQHKLNIALK